MQLDQLKNIIRAKSRLKRKIKSYKINAKKFPKNFTLFASLSVRRRFARIEI